MADNNNTMSSGMSLNQRHILLSASHSKPTNTTLPSFTLRNDDVPSFSFDSPSPPRLHVDQPAKEQVNNQVPNFNFNLDDSPVGNDVVSGSYLDRSSVSVDEVNSGTSYSKLDEDAPTVKRAVSPISPLAGFDSSSPSVDEQTDDQSEVNLGDSTAEKDDIPLKDDLDRGDSSSPSLEQLNDQAEEDVEEALTETRRLSPFSIAHSVSLPEDEQTDDQLEVNLGDSTAEEDDIPLDDDLGRGDSSSPSLEQLNDQAEENVEEALTETRRLSPFSIAHSVSLPEDEMEPSKPEFGSSVLPEKNGNDFVRNSDFSGVSSFNTSITGGQDKQKKVKIAGRRRLCKISAKDADDETEKSSEEEMPKVSDFTDFDSPQVKNIVGNHCDGGANEIRDILGDLSSRLETLSIEKKRPPKKIDVVKGSEDAVRGKVNTVKKVDTIPEYESARSTFSVSSAFSSDIAKESRVGDPAGNEYGRDCDWSNQFEGHGFSERVNKAMNIGERLKKGESKNPSGKCEPVKHFSRTKTSRQEEDDEDCVIVSGKGVAKQGARPSGKSKHISNYSNEVEELDGCGEALFAETKDLFTLSDPKSSYRLPAGIAKMLYPHQRDGLKWLWSLHCQRKGGILGDDMGLGKTMQICGFLTGLFHSKLIKRALIVAPKTLLPHWIKELSAVGLSRMTREYFGTCTRARQYELDSILQGKGILLTTYDIVRNNVKSLSGNHRFQDEESEDGSVWDYMILDEGHLIKNPSTQRAKSLLEIPCALRIIISGTPIQNNLKELWALFNFSCPGLLGDKKWFKEKYENHILRANNKDASDREKRIGSTVAKELRERIQPYFLRRMKSEVFLESDTSGGSKLSKKNEIIVWLKLTSSQRHIYEAFLNSEIVLSAFDGSPLAALTILKKICDHPLLLTKRAAEDVLEGMEETMLNEEDRRQAEDLTRYIADVAERFDINGKHEVSCKISFIMSLLDNLIPEGHNVLIFSQTRKMLNLIQDALSSSGYEFMRIDGTTKASDRLKIVDEFQEGNGAPIFLLTSQVGGLGLTLTNADRVIVVDPAWNPSTDNQSVDRAYRIGQTKDVIVYRLMTCGTVEEKIYRKQVFKGGLFKTATEHKEQIRYFSQQDLKDMFSLPKDGFDVSVTQQQLQEEHGQQHSMDDLMKTHIKFLENLGIAGVSDHSLLFSKTAPVPVALDEDELTRVRGSTYMGNSSSSSSLERNVDGAAFAFNPKDVKLQQKTSSPSASGEPTEADIRERINRLSQILSNKGTISKLPDNGKKIQDQVDELRSELYRIQMAKRAGNQVIDLDEISGDFQRVLNV